MQQISSALKKHSCCEEDGFSLRQSMSHGSTNEMGKEGYSFYRAPLPEKACPLLRSLCVPGGWDPIRTNMLMYYFLSGGAIEFPITVQVLLSWHLPSY